MKVYFAGPQLSTVSLEANDAEFIQHAIKKLRLIGWYPCNYIQFLIWRTLRPLFYSDTINIKWDV